MEMNGPCRFTSWNDSGGHWVEACVGLRACLDGSGEQDVFYPCRCSNPTSLEQIVKIVLSWHQQMHLLCILCLSYVFRIHTILGEPKHVAGISDRICI